MLPTPHPLGAYGIWIPCVPMPFVANDPCLVKKLETCFLVGSGDGGGVRNLGRQIIGCFIFIDYTHRSDMHYILLVSWLHPCERSWRS